MKPHKVTVKRKWAAREINTRFQWPIRTVFFISPAGRKALAEAKGAKK